MNGFKTFFLPWIDDLQGEVRTWLQSQSDTIIISNATLSFPKDGGVLYCFHYLIP